jgi:hypothetical protein
MRFLDGILSGKQETIPKIKIMGFYCKLSGKPGISKGKKLGVMLSGVGSQEL